MSVVEPVLALDTLNQELMLGLRVLSRCLLTVAIHIEERIIVHIGRVLVVLWGCFELATEWHLGVTAVAPEARLAVELVDLVTLMAFEHACETKPMRLHLLGELLLGLWFLSLDLLEIASLT